MRKIYKLCFTVFAGLTVSLSLFAQNRFFTDAGENRTMQTTGQRVIIPQKFRTSSLDVLAMKNFLWSLPKEAAARANRNQMPVIELPMPNGTTAKFRVWESSIQEPGLEAKFPDIKTFAGQGIDDPYATVRLDFGPNGFHAQVLTVNGSFYIDPYARGAVKDYITYFRTDLQKAGTFLCEVPDNPSFSRPENTEAACLGTDLRTYRLAVACTGEYAQAPGISAGANASILHNAIVTSVNRVVGVYEKEVSIRMVLVANNNLVEFLNAATDPFTGNNNANVLINESQTVIDANIGSANYDIGHTFSTGGGGLAQLNSPCGSSKARGITGSPSPTGDAYDIDYVAHEMGHQFGGNHSMAGCGSSPNSTKYEVGSGTTIQAYAGICGGENIQPNSDPHFHAISFDEISNFVVSGGGTCGVVTPTGNTLPVIDPLPNNGVSIPPSTPFTLSGSATDANGDALTYNWEQWDIGGGSVYTWNAGATAAAGNTVPLFKSRVPKTTGSRTFPDMAVILAGYPANPASAMNGLKGETLSPVARPMKFRLTVRDNRANGGGVTSSGSGCQGTGVFQVNVVGTTPFTVSVPNGGESYGAGSLQTITWNNAGTNAAPYNAPNVRITMSTDGGLTYPHLVTASTPNDGSELLTIPSVPATTTARIKIEAIDNVFFDISNANFSITIPVNGYTLGTPTTGTSACPAVGPINSSLPVNFQGTYTGPVAVAYLSGAPAGVTVNVTPASFTANGTATVEFSGAGLTTLAPGTYNVTVQGTGPAPGTTQTATVSFTINPGSGPAITGQPASLAVCSGNNASFAVIAASGTYQWQVSTPAVPAFTNIGGATASTLTLTAVTAGMSGNQYRCIVTGQCGSTTSNPATLTVNVAPAVTTNPTSQSVCSGSAVSFTAAGTGTPTPTYQWQVSTIAVPAFTNIAGATNATYTIASAALGDNGNQYRCVLTNSCGSVNTTAATLTVNSSITVSTNPVAQTVCEATNISFTVAAAGSGLSYQWQVSTDGGTTYNNVAATAPYSGTTTPTLTITGVPPTFNNNRYRAVISNGVCTPGISTGALLTVNTFPSIGTQPQNLTICEGAGATFSVAATTGVGSLTYQWQVSTNGGGTYTNITGATSSSFAQASVPVGQNGYRFRVIVTAGCGSVTSNAGILTVNAYPVISFSPTSIVCVSDGAVSLSATPSGGTFSGAGVSGSTFTPSVAGVGIKTVTYTVSNAGCQSVLSKTIQVNECAERHLTLEQFPAILVYPVPNNGSFNIRLNTDLYTKLNIKIYNSQGQLMKSEVATGLTYGSVIPVYLYNAPSGTYHLFLTNDERGEVSRKGVSVVIYK